MGTRRRFLQGVKNQFFAVTNKGEFITNRNGSIVSYRIDQSDTLAPTEAGDLFRGDQRKIGPGELKSEDIVFFVHTAEAIAGLSKAGYQFIKDKDGNRANNFRTDEANYKHVIDGIVGGSRTKANVVYMYYNPSEKCREGFVKDVLEKKGFDYSSWLKTFDLKTLGNKGFEAIGSSALLGKDVIREEFKR